MLLLSIKTFEVIDHCSYRVIWNPITKIRNQPNWLYNLQHHIWKQLCSFNVTILAHLQIAGWECFVFWRGWSMKVRLFRKMAVTQHLGHFASKTHNESHQQSQIHNPYQNQLKYSQIVVYNICWNIQMNVKIEPEIFERYLTFETLFSLCSHSPSKIKKAHRYCKFLAIDFHSCLLIRFILRYYVRNLTFLFSTAPNASNILITSLIGWWFWEYLYSNYVFTIFK